MSLKICTLGMLVREVNTNYCMLRLRTDPRACTHAPTHTHVRQSADSSHPLADERPTRRGYIWGYISSIRPQPPFSLTIIYCKKKERRVGEKNKKINALSLNFVSTYSINDMLSVHGGSRRSGLRYMDVTPNTERGSWLVFLPVLQFSIPHYPSSSFLFTPTG